MERTKQWAGTNETMDWNEPNWNQMGNVFLTRTVEVTYMFVLYNTIQDGFTPLTWAVRAGHVESVRLLLDRGANPERRDPMVRDV